MLFVVKDDVKFMVTQVVFLFLLTFVCMRVRYSYNNYYKKKLQLRYNLQRSHPLIQKPPLQREKYLGSKYQSRLKKVYLPSLRMWWLMALAQLKGFSAVSILAVSHTSANWISPRINVSAKSVQVNAGGREQRAEVQVSTLHLCGT